MSLFQKAIDNFLVLSMLTQSDHITSQISQCAKSAQFQVISKDQDQTSQSNLKTWQGVAAVSEGEPKVVMEFLLSVQQFDLSADWAELHVLPKHFHKVRSICFQCYL